MQQQDPFVYIEQRGSVFETEMPEEVYLYGDPYRGFEVGAEAPDLQAIVFSFYFTIPRVTDEPGVYNVLTLARGVASRPPRLPRFWNPVRLDHVHGGVYLYLTYDAARGRFGARMNTGKEDKALEGFFLDGFPPHVVAGRLFHFVGLLRADVLYASLNTQDGGPELSIFGRGDSTGRLHHPWAAPSSGHWWLVSGVGADDDDRSLPFPAGFGLSDLRVVFLGEPEDDGSLLPYSGALDHLLFDPPPADEPDPAEPDDDGAAAVQALVDLAEGCRRIAGDLRAQSWRVDAYAAEADRLASIWPE